MLCGIASTFGRIVVGEPQNLHLKRNQRVEVVRIIFQNCVRRLCYRVRDGFLHQHNTIQEIERERVKFREQIH